MTTSIEIFNVCTHCKDGGPMTTGIPTQCTISAHPHTSTRFATAGGDSNIFIWRFCNEYECGMEQLAKLTFHTKPVHAISWDTTGKLLASAGDDLMIAVWKKDEKYDYKQSAPSFGHDKTWKEKWQPQKKLRGAIAEISDIVWINNNKNIIISSLDGIIGLYDVTKQSLISSIKMSTQFVQGIAIDPTNNLLAAQSTSATAKIFRIAQNRKIISNKNKDKDNDDKNTNNNTVKYKISYKIAPFQSISYYPLTKQQAEQQKIYNEEYKQSLQSQSESAKTDNMELDGNDNKTKTKPKKKRIGKNSLFKHNLITTSKKPCWSPDGLLLCMVAGQSPDKTQDAVHIFHRSSITKKITTILLPESSHATVVRFNPLKLVLNNDEIDNGSIVQKYNMKYRMLFALICGSELFIFDTSKNNAIFYWKDEDTQNFFDMDWSADGKSLIVSDIEGFISRTVFDNNDFHTINMT